MLVTPHTLSVLGYFDQLLPSNFAAFKAVLAEITEHPSTFFSVKNTSYPSVVFQIRTSQVTFSPETDLATELDNLIEALENNEWENATLAVLHGKRTLNLGVKHIGAFRNEQLTATIDNANGICQLTALFREGFDTGAYLLRVAAALDLSDKRKKASRYIPESLETKLLCDSMHLCNVCRGTVVIIHHIVPVEEAGPSEEQNLILLCPNHHNDAHSKSNLSKALRPDHLREYKRRHLLWVANRGSTTIDADTITSSVSEGAET